MESEVQLKTLTSTKRLCINEIPIFNQVKFDYFGNAMMLAITLKVTNYYSLSAYALPGVCIGLLCLIRISDRASLCVE